MKKLSLNKIFNVLGNQQPSEKGNKCHLDFEIRGKIRPKQIRKFLKLDFEILVYRLKDGKNYLITDCYKSVHFFDHLGEVDSEDIVAYLHTHPGKTSKNGPSLFDLESLEYTPNSKTMVLDSEGICLYNKPIKNPITGQKLEEKISSMDLYWEMYWNFKEKIGFEPLMSEELARMLQYGFVVKSGAIDKIVKWEDNEECQYLLDSFNK